MINVKFHNKKDELITQAAMHHAPSKGDKIWLLPAEDRQSSYEVVDVCHWVGDNTAANYIYHECCVYVKPVR
jgi:hypothetical protein